MIRFPTGDVVFRMLGDLEQQVDAAEEQVDFWLAQRKFSLLCQDKTILHGVSDAHGGREIHNASRPFKRVGSAHQDLQLAWRSLTTLELEQTAG